MEKNYKELNERINSLLAEFGKENQGIMRGFMQMHKTMDNSGTLSPKTKELMAIAISVVKQCEGCIAYHINRALKCGATRSEITETIGVSVFMGGGPSLVYASIALKALGDFENE